MTKRPRPVFAVNIQRYRDERGWSQEQLQARAGVSSVKMIESGKQGGRVDTLLKIAAALGVTIGDLFEDRDAPMPDALKEFLETPGAKDVRTEEIEQLKRLRARGHRPTAQTYYWALQMLRSMESTKEES